MSSIINKPFSWANKIIQAVFKGSPNLITTSDLNRQLEAFKKEMYLTQQGLGVIISDLSVTPPSSGSDYTTSGSYVYCAGMRFDIDLTGTHTIPSNSIKELRLYAKKDLITYEDDFSKNISGAKFTDGTTQPAADHYVYSLPEVALVDASLPNDNFEYPGNSGKEYVCTLVRFQMSPNPASAFYPKDSMYQMFTVPMGSNIFNLGMKNGSFRQFTVPTYTNTARELVPNADDTWQDCTHKLWSRLYNLEKRFFQETQRGEDNVNVSFGYNGIQFSNNRQFFKVYTSLENFGICELAYNFHLVGNICFAAGHTTFEKNTLNDPLTRFVTFTVGEADNELPHSLYYMDTSCALTVQNRSDLNAAGVSTNSRGYLDRNRLVFVGIPTEGAHFYWYVVYCFSSRKFWQNSVDDQYGNFNDMR